MLVCVFFADKDSKHLPNAINERDVFALHRDVCICIWLWEIHIPWQLLKVCSHRLTFSPTTWPWSSTSSIQTFFVFSLLDLVPPSPYPDNSSHLSHCLNAICQTIVWEWCPVRRVLGAHENTPRKQDLWPQFLWNINLFLVCVFVFLPAVVGMSEFFPITHYCLLLYFN